ncbi:hypothetical protein AB5I41_31465 [Sphingomonas sp. MMS24-JH45]
MVEVRCSNGLTLAMLPYSEYGRQDGSGFSSAASVKAYLDGEFAKFNSLRPHTHVIADVSGLQGL